ncbi:glycosyltransferase [Roseicyclus sp.]|uniref:rhamnosyltransferase WsaF family glycosyltransferase n=1 Tax=Roseicyclus sp. TaxID=1914329 RepID=UPI001BCD13E8
MLKLLNSILPAASHRVSRDVSEAFDPAFYRVLHADFAALSDQALLRHFMESGWQAGLDPTPFFSVRRYLTNNTDVAAANVNPFAHYMARGRSEGRATHLSFWGRDKGPEHASNVIGLVRNLFDAEHYHAQVPALAHLPAETLLSHYLVIGWLGGLTPSARFSGAAYLEAHPDVRNAGTNPFLHFALYGQKEGRLLAPWQDGAQAPSAPATASPQSLAMLSDQEAVASIAAFFDAEFYAAQYPDMRGNAHDLALHYHKHGWREGRNPAADFETAYYLQTNPELADAGVNPLLHYAQIGVRFAQPKTRPLRERVDPRDLDAVRHAFDPAFYRAMNPDVDASTDDALLIHYMAIGWRERRDPRPDFSTRYYIERYPDIASGDINPFLHYILFGKAEGRRVREDAPFRLLKGAESASLPLHLQVVLHAAKTGRKQIRPPAKIQMDALTQHWIVPDFQPGSGGHMTIFRMIKFQEMFGHRCKVWIEAPVFHTTPAAAWDTIVKHFQCIGAEVDFVENGFFDARGDAVIATGWSTAYLARAATGFHEKFYFVQDHEVEFYPTGSERLLALQTYHFGLSCICASPWLESMMRERYGLWARSFHLAYDAEIYTPTDPSAQSQEQTDGPLRIAVYARNHTARRCVALSLIALEQLATTRDDFEVHFFGQADLPFVQAGFSGVNHGVLGAQKLAALYRSCDIGICFSGTNYSLVPQEMMACGLPVVELDGESTRAIFPKGVVTLAGPEPADIAAKLAKLLDNKALRRKQAKQGQTWAAGFSWDDSARIVEGAMRDRLVARKASKIAAPAVARPKQTQLDVVIPTWNGLGETEPVIAAIRRQNMAEAIQIYCIDSNSSDGTAQWLRAQRDIALIEIDQADFQHGRTRNQAAAAGTAPLIAFLTQDAIPATATWAHDICAMFAHVPTAAGLFGRHIPYPHHPAWVRQEIEGHFDNMLQHPLVLSRDTDPEKWASGDLGWRQLLHFYSDNNSAMRRAVWADFPYPEVDYGEDQVWARDIIEAGLTKLFAPTACVYHSHDYDPDETFKRARTEAAFFFTHFGYALGDGTEDALAARIKREQTDYRGWAYRYAISPKEEPRRLGNIEAKHRGWKAGLDEARGALIIQESTR